ncbi:hypothetical protein ACM25P_18255 [Vreelandella alkaliphila]|uniref:hypothetical protein n=1 Tax=Halomonadaceae TaxID=28256 RepID=UPI001E603268|nr:hypothetical protein [Halomonas sp. IOP_6]MCD6003567.1 hypothetical protein [Halomonas sp. IOP_6]
MPQVKGTVEGIILSGTIDLSRCCCRTIFPLCSKFAAERSDIHSGSQVMSIKLFGFIEPAEENRYCVFGAQLEDDENVFFHITHASNKQAIITNVFKSAKELGVGELESVSYAKRSSGCFANLGTHLQEEYVIFAVRFTLEELKEVAVNPSDIHVYKKHLQPEKLGVVHLPKGLQLS